jgi:hypothetical protein
MRTVLFLVAVAVALAGCGATLSLQVTVPTTYDVGDDCDPANDAGATMPADSLGATTIEASASASGPWTLWDSRAVPPGTVYTYTRTVPMSGPVCLRVTARNKGGLGCPLVLWKQPVGGLPSKAVAR